jgi:hypothetical protein
MTDHRAPPAPRRLSQLSGEAAEWFAAAESEYRGNLDEGRAWQKLQERLDEVEVPLHRHSWRPTVTALTIAAGLVAGWFGWQSLRGLPLFTERRPAPTIEEPSTVPTASIRLADGRSQLPDGTEVELRGGARGTYVSSPRESTVEFDRGRLDIGVARQPKGRSFVVRSQGFEFRVLGTRFSVNVEGSRVDLDVTEGRVQVARDTMALKVVEPGGHWSNLDEIPKIDAGPVEVHSTLPTAHPKSAPVGSVRVAEPSDPTSCRDLLRAGNPRKSEQCYLDIAAGGGLSAEIALYEVARLRRDVLSNPAGSLAALDEYETRFDAGTLAPEVHMARIDVLARLGRVSEALHASERLLSSSSGRARKVELHLLRGNLLRDKQGDCGAAEAEYAQIESDPGPRGDQAQLARAGCLERLGRHDEAAAAYRSYLRRTKPQQSERARQRLESLQR